MNGVTYAIADLHGRHDLLLHAYHMIDNHHKAIEDAAGTLKHKTIVHLGDYVDRGPHSKAVIEFLMNDYNLGERAAQGLVKRVVLKGNHEAMMVETLQKPLHPAWWYGNGGDATMMSYATGTQRYWEAQVDKDHIKWLDQLPHYHEDEHRFFVHAFVDPTKSLEQQDQENMLWQLWPRGYSAPFNGKHVVHGHEQFEEGPMLYQHRTNLDVGGFYSNRIVVGVFIDSVPGGPINILDTRPQNLKGSFK